jgi:alkylation response protein AidB-like acyl-CoA dehydrogenase
VPVTNRIGEENGGWTVAKYLLEFERGVGHQVPALFVELDRVRDIAGHEGGDQVGPLSDDPDFRRRLAELSIEALAAHYTEQRLAYSRQAGDSLGDATASLMKLCWSETGQRIDALAIDALGHYRAADQNDAFGASPRPPPVGPDYALTPMRRYLNDLVMTIAGGSSEVQRNILARITLRS